MGTMKAVYRKRLSVFSRSARSTTLASKNCGLVLLVQPLEKFLKTSVGQDGFHRVERVAKFVVTPRLVDEILTGMAGRHDFGAAFAARHYVVSTCRDLTFAKDARLGHRHRRKHSEAAQHGKWRKKWESHP